MCVHLVLSDYKFNHHDPGVRRLPCWVSARSTASKYKYLRIRHLEFNYRAAFKNQKRVFYGISADTA
jgi:hypothetical protein